MKSSLLCFTLLTAHLSFSQNNKQNIRGNIIDKLSQSSIIGATVQIQNNFEKNGTQTDVNGQYVLLNLAPNRYGIKVSNMGSKEVVIPNVIVTSGKEVIFLRLLNEVVVKASNKANTVNKLASISAQSFSMEEVNRYAGGRSDPARLAANFAGVSAPDDSRDDIVSKSFSAMVTMDYLLRLSYYQSSKCFF